MKGYEITYFDPGDGGEDVGVWDAGGGGGVEAGAGGGLERTRIIYQQAVVETQLVN